MTTTSRAAVDDSAILVQRSRLRHVHRAIGPALLALASFVVMWPFARLDFDRFNDGYMLAQATAVHEGVSVQSGVFGQYGPVTPWLQSLSLFFPIGPGLALRTINLAFISVTVFLLADMGRKAPYNWPVSPSVGWWAAIAWIVLADVWMGLPLHPWSSTLAAMISVATLYLLTRSLRYAEDARPKAAAVSALVGGLALGLIPFTRINVGLSAMATCLGVTVLMFIVEIGIRRTIARLFIVGTLLSLFLIIIVLTGAGSLADYYRQAIVWPLSWGGNRTIGISAIKFLATILVSQLLPVSLVSVMFVLSSRMRKANRAESGGSSAANASILFVGVIIVTWEGVINFHCVKGLQRSVSSTLFLFFTAPNQWYLYLFMALSIVAALFVCVIQMFRLISRRKSTAEVIPWLLLGGLALSGLTQVFPEWDLKHVWWAAPIGLLLLFSSVRANFRRSSFLLNPLALPLLAAALMSIFSGSAYWGSPRVLGLPGTVIEGMWVNEATFNEINQDTKFLNQHLHRSDSVIYLVRDGDLSVLSGKFRSADAYFVEWGGPRPFPVRIETGNPIVVQTNAFGGRNIGDFARSIRYSVIATNRRLAVLRPVDRTQGSKVAPAGAPQS